MSYLESDMRREVLLACNKARVSMSAADIQTVLADVSDEIGGYVEAQSPPASTGKPTITGTAQVGQTLTCAPGQWTGSPTSHRYQWQAAGAAIDGATGVTLLLAAAQEGAAVACQEWASNPKGEGGPATSDPTGAVAPAA